MKKPRFKTYDLEDYPEVKDVKFPKEVYVSFAVCGKKCGNKEFIIDGQSQVCQYCGKLMFRTDVAKYILKKLGKKKKS